MKYIYSSLLMLIITSVLAQNQYIVTHGGESIYGDLKIRPASVMGMSAYKVVARDESNKKIRMIFYESEILKMKDEKNSAYVAKWIGDDKDSRLFDQNSRSILAGYYLWKLEYQSMGSVPDGLGGSVMTSSTSISYYLENPDKKDRLEYIPSGRKTLIKYLREKNCQNVVRDIEAGNLNHKNLIEVITRYLNRCVNENSGEEENP
ncbi:MAG: hypothetical protein RIM99_10870 [Cyclobacteriaceae bacterium]